jgi:hypothetical protein
MENIAEDSNLSEGSESDQQGSSSEVSLSSCESQALQNLTTQEPKNMFLDDSGQLTSQKNESCLVEPCADKTKITLKISLESGNKEDKIIPQEVKTIPAPVS